MFSDEFVGDIKQISDHALAIYDKLRLYEDLLARHLGEKWRYGFMRETITGNEHPTWRTRLYISESGINGIDEFVELLGLREKYVEDFRSECDRELGGTGIGRQTSAPLEMVTATGVHQLTPQNAEKLVQEFNASLATKITTRSEVAYRGGKIGLSELISFVEKRMQDRNAAITAALHARQKRRADDHRELLAATEHMLKRLEDHQEALQGAHFRIISGNGIYFRVYYGKKSFELRMRNRSLVRAPVDIEIVAAAKRTLRPDYVRLKEIKIDKSMVGVFVPAARVEEYSIACQNL